MDGKLLEAINGWRLHLMELNKIYARRLRFCHPNPSTATTNGNQVERVGDEQGQQLNAVAVRNATLIRAGI